MKKSTLLAVVALLTFLIPQTGWGQTRDEISWTASEQGYENQQEITDVEFDDYVSATFNKGTNNNNPPKYYTTGSAIRCYGGNNFVFSTASGNLTKIVITFGSSDGSNAITTNVGTYSNGTWTGEAEEVTFTIGGTSGNRRIAGFTITYSTGGSTLEDNDLALTGSPITLNFDLYNNAEPQVINYTTSSTGAVTLASNDYVTAEVNSANKTITVTPVAITNGDKAITVNQAADDNYKSGSATFNVNITSSAPYVQPTEFVIGLNNTLFGTTYEGSVSNITDANPIVGTQDNVTVTYAGGGNHYVNDSQIRFYSSNKLTFEAPDGYEIKKIVFTADGTWSATISADGGTYDDATKTWTGSATSVVFSGSGSGQCRMASALITLGEPSTDPTIDADNVNIAYDATEGGIAYTINNPVPGTLLQATADAGWISNITVGESAITFNATANEANTERVATFTLTYEGAEDKTVTVTQAAAPMVYTTIPDLFAAATNTVTDVKVQFNNWVVTGVSTNGRNVFVTDGTNGFVIYDGEGSLASTYAVGNTLTGLVSCNLKLQNGYAQLQDVDAADLTIGTGGSVDFASIAMAELAGVNTGALVQYDNLTCSVDNNRYYLSDGTTTLQVYNSLYADASTTLEAGKVYNIKGVYQQYNTTKEILPRDADDIEEVVSEDAAVTLANYNISVAAEGGEAILTVQYQNIDEIVADIQFYEEDGVTETTADSYDWLVVELDDDNNVTYLADANTGEERKAYFKVFALDNNSATVYSELITITQAAAPQQYALTIESLTNTEIFVFVGGDWSNPALSGEGTIQVLEGQDVALSVDPELGYTIESLVVDGANVTAQIDNTGLYTFTMPSHAVTVTATSVEPLSTEGNYVKVTSTADITDGEYLIVYEDGNVAFDGGLETLDASGNTIDVTIGPGNIIESTPTVDAATFTIESIEGGYSIKSKSGLYIGRTANSNGLNSSETTVYTNTIEIDENKNAVITSSSDRILRYNKDNGQTRFRYYGSGQQAIQLYKKVAPTTATITIKEGFTATTFSCDKALDFSNMEITAFIITDENGTTAEVTKVPANRGIYVEGAEGKYEVPILADEAADIDLTGNLLVATEQATGQVLAFTPESNTVYYVFGKQNGKEAFYKVPATGYTLTEGNKAVLKIENTPFAGAKEMIMVNGGTTAIDNLPLTTDHSGAVYNLQGQRVQTVGKGVYVVNGRKVVVK